MKKYCVNCISFNVCKYVNRIKPYWCSSYLFKANPIREIMQEHERQDKKWGEQNHPMRGLSDDNNIKRGTILYPEDSTLKNTLSTFRYRNETKKAGWFDILQEEVYEAFLETEPEKQREEMIQVAAVAVQIIECLDRRMEEAERES